MDGLDQQGSTHYQIAAAMLRDLGRASDRDETGYQTDAIIALTHAVLAFLDRQ